MLYVSALCAFVSACRRPLIFCRISLFFCLTHWYCLLCLHVENCRRHSQTGSYPKSDHALNVSKTLHKGTNFAAFATNLAKGVTEIDAFKCLLGALSSTVHDDETMLHLISSVGNCCDSSSAVGSWLPQVLLGKGALNELQPAVLSNNPAVGLDASFTITALALRKDAAEVLEASNAIAVIQDMLRTIAPGTVEMPHLRWGSNDAPGLCARLSADAHPVVQLSCLHSVSATLGNASNRRVIGGPIISAAVRAVAATQDPFVFGATMYILRILGMPLPTYRAVRAVRHENLFARFEVHILRVPMICFHG